MFYTWSWLAPLCYRSVSAYSEAACPKPIIHALNGGVDSLRKHNLHHLGDKSSTDKLTQAMHVGPCLLKGYSKTPFPKLLIESRQKIRVIIVKCISFWHLILRQLCPCISNYGSEKMRYWEKWALDAGMHAYPFPFPLVYRCICSLDQPFGSMDRIK